MGSRAESAAIGGKGEQPLYGDDELVDYEESVKGADDGGHEEGGARKRRRGNGQGLAAQGLPHIIEADQPMDNVSQANEPPLKEERLYWVSISPSDSASWTEAQKESAIRITVPDLSSCALLSLTEITSVDTAFPDRFAQTGSTTTDDERAIKGLQVAFETSQQRDKFVTHNAGCMLVSASEDAENDEAQVLYTVKRDDAQPEMAFALMRRQSGSITIYTRRSRIRVTPSMINRAVETQTTGLTLVTKARYVYERDANGRPMKSAMGAKPEFHVRVMKSEKYTLPRVFCIQSFPYRFVTQHGYFKECNTCHQSPCECEDVKADLQRQLEYKQKQRDAQQMRAGARKHKEAPPAQAGGAPPPSSPHRRAAHRTARTTRC